MRADPSSTAIGRRAGKLTVEGLAFIHAPVKGRPELGPSVWIEGLNEGFPVVVGSVGQTKELDRLLGSPERVRVGIVLPAAHPRHRLGAPQKIPASTEDRLSILALLMLNQAGDVTAQKPPGPNQEGPDRPGPALTQGALRGRK